MSLSTRARQGGAVLFIALIMLLVVTLVALAGMRETHLEGRITGNRIEQERLFSAAESALREGEGKLRQASSSLDACSASASPCYTTSATTYNTDFSTSVLYSGLDGNTTLLRSARWYIRYISSSCNSAGGGSSNSYLSKRQAGCTYYYELNSEAYKGTASSKSCGPDALCLRSTFGLVLE